MKTNNLSFPHPVLGVHDDVQGLHNVEVKLTCSETSIDLSVQNTFFNKTIENLITKKKAAFCAQISCPQTFFRRIFTTQEKNQEISIPQTELRNKATAEFFVIAVEDIPNYQNDRAHPDYEDVKFDIGKGDVLSFGGRFSFIADKQWMSSKSVASFMAITRGDFNDGPMEIDLNADSGKIVVELSKKDFDKFKENARNTTLYPVFHSCIVFPALMFALNQMAVPDGKDQYGEYLWYQVLEDRKRNDEQLKHLSWGIENVSEIAQVILRNPINRVFTSIDNLLSLDDEG